MGRADALIISTHTVIVIYEKDLFDYRQGEPPEELLTVLRSLEVCIFSLSDFLVLILNPSRFPTHMSCASLSIRRI
jgi:hypothetical protein